MQQHTTTTKLSSGSIFYNIGLGLGIAGLVAQLIFQKIWLTETLILCAGGLFGIGYLTFLFNFIKHRWASSFGKVYLTVAHTAIFFIAFIPARWCVSSVMGLPAQDFDITVSVVSALIYPSLWLMAASLIILCNALVAILLGVLVHISTFPIIDDIFRLLALAFPDGSAKAFMQAGRREFAGRMIKHWAGAIVVSLVMSFAGTWPMQALVTYKQPIKWIAIAADYQQADLMPGIEQDTRYRLHENGVVSYASFADWQVSIRVSMVGKPMAPLITE